MAFVPGKILVQEQEKDIFRYDVYDKILNFMFQEHVINVAFGQTALQEQDLAVKNATFFSFDNARRKMGS